MGDQNEGTKVVNIVIAILVFMVVAAAMIGFVMWGANKFNEAQSDLTDTVNGMDVSKYNAYDAKYVSGADVISAAKTYRDMEMTIFIGTKKKHGGFYTVTAVNDGDTASDVKALGYHAKADGTGAQGVPTWSDATGHWEVALSEPDNNNDNNFSVLTTKGQDYYVNQAARFYAELVWDTETEEVAGIIFRQVEKN